jgi:hypothetical protein
MDSDKRYVSLENLIAQERVGAEMMRDQIEQLIAYAEKRGWEVEIIDDEIVIHEAEEGENNGR